MVRTLNCGPYTVELFAAGNRQTVVYAVMDQADAQAVWPLLKEPKPTLAAISGVDWNRELSPWPAPKVFRDGEDFGGDGPAFLDMLTGRIVPLAETQLGFAPVSRAVAGYSLAGLFALWSVFQTDVFDRAASVSGSLWFDGFMDYMNSSAYFPVVLLAKKKPMVGMLMMPKTMAYIWMIAMGREFENKVAVVTGGAKDIGKCIRGEFEYAQRVGVTAPFYLTKLFLPHFAPGACIVNISSSRDRMSQPQSENYTAAKGGIAALTHALAVSLRGRVRVNSISLAWINTGWQVYEGPDAAQQPAGRVGNPLDIANMVLYLCSDKAEFITGENICIDGGMTRQMIYHNDFGWKLEE